MFLILILMYLSVAVFLWKNSKNLEFKAALAWGILPLGMALVSLGIITIGCMGTINTKEK